VARSHDPYVALREPGFRRYLIGWLTSLIGTRIQSVAIGWEMYQRTGDALALGMVGLAQALPAILLALPGGLLADRYDRRRIVMGSMAGIAFVSLGLAILSFLRGPILLMYALLVLDATVLAIGRPARMAMLPQLVSRETFPNAVTWNTSMWEIASVVGPGIGGFIVALHVPLAYVLCSASSIAFIALLIPMRVRGEHMPAGASSRDELGAGLRFVWRSRVVLAAISLDMFAVLLGGATYLLPIFAKDILAVGATGFGWLNAAPAAGALCMALLLAHLPPMQRAGRNLLLCVAGFGLATIVFGLSRSFWLSLAVLFLAGALDNVSVVIRHTLIQLATPDHMRGRVSAVNGVFLSASNELGGLESGLVAHFFGPVISVVSGGIGTLAVVVTTAFVSPALRAVGSLHQTPTSSQPDQPRGSSGAT
jgi:MFS family permease